MKKDFQTSSKAPVNSVCTDAVNFVMDNVFDWDSHKEHDGLRLSYEDCKTLAKSLKTNLRSTCPDVHDEKMLENYTELLHNNWAGQFSDIKDLTQKVVTAHMEAEVRNFEPMKSLSRFLNGKIDFMETHYHEVSHAQEVPVHVLSDAMESKEDSARSNVENRTALVQQFAGVVDNAKASENSYARRKFPGLFKMLGM